MSTLRKTTVPIAGRVQKGMPKEKLSPQVMTIGHSTRTLDEFIRLLQAHGVSCVVDVRTAPRSQHNPQFNKASLLRSLKKGGRSNRAALPNPVFSAFSCTSMSTASPPPVQWTV